MKKALEFVELQTFTKRFHNAGITDEQLRYLQNELIDNPLKGKLIRGTGGLRKVRLKAIEDKGRSQMSKMYEGLKEGLEEALRYVQGDHTVAARVTKVYYFESPKDYSASQVRMIRIGSGMTQPQFAQFFGVSSKTVEAWESGRNHPTGPSRRLMELLANGDIKDLPFVKVQE